MYGCMPHQLILKPPISQAKLSTMSLSRIFTEFSSLQTLSFFNGLNKCHINRMRTNRTSIYIKLKKKMEIKEVFHTILILLSPCVKVSSKNNPGNSINKLYITNQSKHNKHGDLAKLIKFTYHKITNK